MVSSCEHSNAMSTPRPYRAGESVEDLCRVCKIDRLHTIIVVGEGKPIRVACDYCHSEHNYRGGATSERSSRTAEQSTRPDAPRASSSRTVFPIVSDRERIAPAMTSANNTADLELLLRRIIREEAGVTPVVPAAKWRGG